MTSKNGAKTYEFIPPGLHLSYDFDEQKSLLIPKVEIVKDPDETYDALLQQVMDNKILDAEKRVKGMYRQLVWALYLRQQDWDSKKRGTDKWRRYHEIIVKTGHNHVDFRNFGAEVWLFEVTKWNEHTRRADYRGVGVFAENTEKGKELVRLLENKHLSDTRNGYYQNHVVVEEKLEDDRYVDHGVMNSPRVDCISPNKEAVPSSGRPPHSAA